MERGDMHRVLKMRKIKLNPTRDQKMMLNKFADGARYSYNAAVQAVNNGHKANKMQLRNHIVTLKDNTFFDDKQWLLQTPKVIRQQAVFEACKNFKAAWSNKRAGNINHFKMTYKSKKKSNGCYVLGLEKQLVIRNGKIVILPETIGEMRHFEKRNFQKHKLDSFQLQSRPTQGKDFVPRCDCYIRKDSSRNFWLMLPTYKDLVAPAADDRPLVAIDPGVRNFLTCYATDGDGFCLGKDMLAAAMGVLKSIDDVDSALSKATGKERRRLRGLKRRLYQKYKNVRDDHHWKIANALSKNYGAILLPHLETKALAGKLRTKTNREMQASSHWLFSQRLKEKCLEKDCVLMAVEEHYTSKTCGCCGRLNEHLGSSKVFTCPCGNVAHRDLHAARNILLKHLHTCELTPAVLQEIDAFVDPYKEGCEIETTANFTGLLHLI